MKGVALSLAVISLTSLFLVGLTTSQAGYDPWYDLDDDGDIDIFDIVDIAGRYGTTGTPINKTSLLLELQERVDQLEEGLNQVKTIRFIDPAEYVVNMTSLSIVTNFTWIPDNTTNNAILDSSVYFDYKIGNLSSPPPPLPEMDMSLRIYSGGICSTGPRLNLRDLRNEEYLTIHRTSADYGLPLPNEGSYNITFWCHIYENEPVYFRNINVFLTVADGIQPTQ